MYDLYNLYEFTQLGPAWMQPTLSIIQNEWARAWCFRYLSFLWFKIYPQFHWEKLYTKGASFI